MRRAMRHAHLLGAAEPLMHRLAPTLVGRDGRGLSRTAPRPARHRRHPAPGRERFRRTLGRGMGLLDEATRGLADGDVAVRRDRLQALRHLWLPAGPDPGRGARRGFTVDLADFDAAMERQRDMAARGLDRLGPGGRGGEWLALRDRLGPTVFTGYDDVDGSRRGAGAGRGRPRGRHRRGRRDRPGPVRPHALLRARAAARPATRARSNGTAAAARVLDVQKQAGDLYRP